MWCHHYLPFYQNSIKGQRTSAAFIKRIENVLILFMQIKDKHSHFQQSCYSYWFHSLYFAFSLWKKAVRFQLNCYRPCGSGWVLYRLRMRTIDVYGSAAAHCWAEDAEMFKHVFLTGPPGTSFHTLCPDVHKFKPIQFSRSAVVLR